MSRDFRDIVPAEGNLGACAHCGSIILLVTCGPVAFAVDPDENQRAKIRRLIGPGSVRRMGFGHSFGRVHLCGAMPDSILARQGLFCYAALVLSN